MDDDLRNRYRRDYTNEVIRPPRPQHQPVPSPASQPSQPHHHAATPAAHTKTHSRPQADPAHRPEKKRKKRRLRLVLVMVILLAAAAGGGYWYKSNKLDSPVPVTIRASVNFPILYPTKLPSGYHLDNNSYTSSGNVVLYSAVNSSGTRIAFTDQQRLANFNFNTFYTQGLSNPTSFDTSIGQAAIGTATDKLLGSLVTDQSWLLVSSTSKSVGSADLKLILSNAKQAPSAK